MVRRELLKYIALATGGTMIGGELFMLSGCKSDATVDTSKSLLSAEQIQMLDEVGEIIIPTTDTPGAKSIGIGAFMHKMVKDCYSKEDQNVFLDGIKILNDRSEKENKVSIIGASADQRLATLNAVDQEARRYMNAKKEDDPTHYFTMMRQLTILGYFTSQAGATQALRYVKVPTKYDGSLPYKKGDKAWAT